LLFLYVVLYRLLVEQLAEVDPSCLSCNEKLAFWINVYNALIMHVILFSTPYPFIFQFMHCNDSIHVHRFPEFLSTWFHFYMYCAASSKTLCRKGQTFPWNLALYISVSHHLLILARPLIKIVLILHLSLFLLGFLLMFLRHF